MPISRKWPDLSIRKKNQSDGEVKTRKILIAAISKVSFLWCSSLDQDKKSVLMDGMAAGMLEGGEDGCSCASLQHIECCTAKHQRQDCSLPSFPANPQLHGWHCMTPGAAWSFPGGIISACISRADGCLSGRKLCLSQGGK